jgi:hypothetical protein
MNSEKWLTLMSQYVIRIVAALISDGTEIAEP